MEFENGMRGIFRPTKGEPASDWRKLHKELHNLYPSPGIIKEIKSRMVSCTWHEYENACRILV
jgi:hypothetical protein